MKVILLTLCSAAVFSLGMVALAHSGGEPNVFLTSAGPVKITPLNHASTLIEAGGKTIYLDPAKPVKLFHDKGRGNGYVLTYGGKRFYFSGDTEGVPEMRALKNIDVAFVCMNLPYTMPPEEAADAVKAFHPKIVIPYHYRGSDLSV